MPDRYWVGGTASWDGTAGTKWAATSGGAGGASVPTTADAVFFDANSTGTVTIATGNTGAASINCTGFTGTITGSAAITVAGSITLVAAMTYTHTGTVTITGTGTLTTAGKTFSGVTVGSTGTLTLGDALNVAGRTITVTQGTFTTNGFAVTASDISSSNSNVRTINLGASTVNLSASGNTIQFATSTNLTFNAGTSQITLNGQFSTIQGGTGQTFHNVTLNRTGVQDLLTVVGNNTFNNLTFSSPSTPGLIRFFVQGNQTINGTLTCAGATILRRLSVFSNLSNTVRTLTVNSLSASNCDFYNITLAGAAAGSAPTNAGNCGGNSGIVFPAAKTAYRVGTNTSWAGINSWALASGGTGADANFPLAQDNAVIDNNTALTGTLNIGAAYNFGGIDFSARTTAITFNHDANVLIFGSYTLSTAVTISGTSSVDFLGQGSNTITSAGKTFTFSFCNFDTNSGSITLLDAMTFAGTASANLTSGTLNLNNFVLTVSQFGAAGSLTRTLAFGAGNITVTGTGVSWNTSPATNMTVTGTPVVNMTNSTATATEVRPGSPLEANAISFNFTAGTYALNLSSGSVRSLDFTGFSGTLNNVARTIFGNLTISTGMTLTAGANQQTFASTSGTPRTITSNGKVFDFPLVFNGVGGTWRLSDALTVGATRGITHTNGTLDLNGFTFTSGIVYQTTAGTKNITFNGGTLILPGASTTFSNSAPTGFTTTAGTGTGTISMTSASAKTFAGGGSTYNCTLNNGGAGALTVTGSNTFTTLANSVQPTSFLFTAGTTTTLTNWNINGTAGNLVTIGSVTAASHTLSKASGTVTGDYLSISRSNATGGATWNATNSTDGGNNTGWVFGAIGIIAALAASEVGPDILAANAFVGYKVLAALAASEIGPDIFSGSATITNLPPPIAGGVFRIELRSFTERRRF